MLIPKSRVLAWVFLKSVLESHIKNFSHNNAQASSQVIMVEITNYFPLSLDTSSK